ncbi:uncharacterized protein METZ01_LOCUS336996, partial [marine metagenome]
TPHRQRNHRPHAAGGVDEFEGAVPWPKQNHRRTEGDDQESTTEVQNHLL